MKTDKNSSEMTESTSDSRQRRPRSAKQPCQRCQVIRLFLIAAAGVGILQLIAPGTFVILQGLGPLTLSICFVAGFGIIAIVKSVAEYLATRADDSDIRS